MKKKEEKTNIFKNIGRGWMKFQDLDLSVLNGIRNFLTIALIIDLFMFFYWLKAENLGTFLFILIIVFLILTLLAERGKKEKMSEKELKKVEKEEKEKKNPLEEVGEDIKKEMQDAVDQIQDEMEGVIPVL